MSKIVNMKGKRFGKFTVIEFAGSKDGYALWKCVCDCGKEKIIRGSGLRSGNTVSCGCWRKEITSSVLTKHGMANSRLYTIWSNMKARCFKQSNTEYCYYGGRGITICDEWKDDFQSFYDWAMANGYKEHLTIDRIDVNGDYSPENCRWVDMKVQSNNRRSNHIIEFNGESHNVKQWSEILGINENTIRTRIQRGYSIEKIFEK